MSANNYSLCLSKILKYEGGYTNHPSDPGGATNYGITIIDARKYWKASATPDDMKAMPLSVAKAIYKSRYWDVVHGDNLPDGIDLCTFDPAVNSGIGRGGPWMASGLDIPWKGYTDLAEKANLSTDLPKAIKAACRKRMSFLQGLKTWSVFGKGWGSRVSDVQVSALTMALKASGKTTPEIIASHKKDILKTKDNQNTTLAGGTLTTGTGGTASVSFWQWDILHVLGAVAILGILVWFVWHIVNNTQTVTAYETEISALEALKETPVAPV